MARNATGETWDSWSSGGTHLHDRDNKFCSVFRGDARGWWYKTDSTPGAQSKPECVRREMTKDNLLCSPEGLTDRENVRNLKTNYPL